MFANTRPRAIGFRVGATGDLVPTDGDSYEEILSAVQQALGPGATVEVAQWVEEPDGRRDMDLLVRGSISGTAFCVLLECKNKARRVGTKVVDALEWKRRSLHADSAILFSNSGFTERAVRKAERMGIAVASPLRKYRSFRLMDFGEWGPTTSA